MKPLSKNLFKVLLALEILLLIAFAPGIFGTEKPIDPKDPEYKERVLKEIDRLQGVESCSVFERAHDLVDCRKEA